MKTRRLMATAAASTLLTISALTSTAAPAQAASMTAPSGAVVQHAHLRAADGNTCSGIYGFGLLDPVLNVVFGLVSLLHGAPC
ncbi:hypothetical protein [Streptomyces sp. BPTC-684]|uniref:hypothetical protein n=1 Tax=Streptomyces sp. BPTC-684 TaxID=3043734 RepID=UPI0024B060B7|nr:hypothetical protein [Streptomyces sp. BPTC-684]WHM40952.1 hypothetical protein QIY60_31480 [Streptomyces sp. BPTC-684]